MKSVFITGKTFAQHGLRAQHGLAKSVLSICQKISSVLSKNLVIKRDVIAMARGS